MSAVGEVSPNSATASVKRWLAKTPTKCATMQLRVHGEGGAAVLGTWDGTEAKPGLAAEIVEAIDAHASATQQHCVASLEWLDAAEKVLQTRSLRRTYQREPEEAGVSLSGSNADQAAQAQRHLEVMTKIYYNGIGGSIQQILKVSEATLRMLETLSARAEQAEQERDALRAALDATAKDTPQDEAQKAQLVQLAAQVIPLLAPRPSAPKPPQGSNGSA
jgi:hypothetical protein